MQSCVTNIALKLHNLLVHNYSVLLQFNFPILLLLLVVIVVLVFYFIFFQYCALSSVPVCSIMSKSSYVKDRDGVIMKYGACFYLGIVAMVLCIVDIVTMFVLQATLRDTQISR